MNFMGVTFCRFHPSLSKCRMHVSYMFRTHVSYNSALVNRESRNYSPTKMTENIEKTVECRNMRPIKVMRIIQLM